MIWLLALLACKNQPPLPELDCASCEPLTGVEHAVAAQEAATDTEAKLDELIVRLREAHPEIVNEVAADRHREGYDLRTIECSKASISDQID